MSNALNAIERFSRYPLGESQSVHCPVRDVLDRIGDKWTVLVVQALRDGTLRFSELRDRVGGVAPKVLTQTLRAIEPVVARYLDKQPRRRRA